MAENCRIAEELGYLKVPEDTRLQIAALDQVERGQTVIMTTGSQGEPLSALSKMAMDEHKQIKIEEGDTVIISATPIPGNEDLVMRTVNRLFKQGAEVVYEPYAAVHVSGHGNQEDIRLMLNLVRPRFVVPVHGEQRHVSKFTVLAESMGYPREKVVQLKIGDILESDGETAEIVGQVTSGSVMVDGLGVGDVEDVVLRDRGHLAKDGVVIAVVGIDMTTKQVVSGPDLFSRGFMAEDYREELIEDARNVILGVIETFGDTGSQVEFDEIKSACRKALAKFIYERTHRRPMIVPIVMEI